MNKKYRPLDEVFEEQTPYLFKFELDGESICSSIDRIIGCIMISTCVNENIATFAGLINGHSAEFNIQYDKDNPIFILKIRMYDINVKRFKYKNLAIDESESDDEIISYE